MQTRIIKLKGKKGVGVRTFLRRLGLPLDHNAIFPIHENDLRIVDYREMRELARKRGVFNSGDNVLFSKSFLHTIPPGTYQMTKYSKGYKLKRSYSAA